MNLYFECNSGISGDMTVAALIDLGADVEKLKRALNSMNLNDEFSFEIKDVLVNSIKAKDFNVILHHNEKNPHHHTHRNLNDINKIIDLIDMSKNAKNISKGVFKIVAEAEARVHNKNIDEVHFHEIGAIDSIVDIVSFGVLYDNINPTKSYFSALCEGYGTVECAHGTLNVPVPAVVEIVSKYKLPVKFVDNEGEMVTPTGAAIAAFLYNGEKLKNGFIIEKAGCGAGKRKYKNPVLRIMKIKEDLCI